MDTIQPEMTDVQKLFIGMNTVNTALNQVQITVAHDHKILIEGNGDLPLVEKVRNNEKFIDNIRRVGWILGGAILVQTITFGTAAVVYFIKLYPILQQIAAQDILVK